MTTTNPGCQWCHEEASHFCTDERYPLLACPEHAAEYDCPWMSLYYPAENASD